MVELQWNIYIASVGFVESEITKLRPVLALSKPVGPHKIVLIAPIFSAKPDHKLAGDVEVVDYNNLGLVKPSTIRLHQLVSLPAESLQEQLGRIPVGLQNTIIAELRKLLEL